MYASCFAFHVVRQWRNSGDLPPGSQAHHGDFFAASGEFFWRLVRLALLSIVPFIIVAMIYQGLSKAADHFGDRAIADQVGIFLSLAALVIFLLSGCGYVCGSTSRKLVR